LDADARGAQPVRGVAAARSAHEQAVALPGKRRGENHYTSVHRRKKSWKALQDTIVICYNLITPFSLPAQFLNKLGNAYVGFFVLSVVVNSITQLAFWVGSVVLSPVLHGIADAFSDWLAPRPRGPSARTRSKTNTPTKSRS
jgi:hypothetical protein